MAFSHTARRRVRHGLRSVDKNTRAEWKNKKLQLYKTRFVILLYSNKYVMTKRQVKKNHLHIHMSYIYSIITIIILTYYIYLQAFYRHISRVLYYISIYYIMFKECYF